MFRRILQRTPGRVGSQGSDLDSSAAPINTVDVNNESSSEGFICPLCMKRCITAIDLSEHYQQVHTENEARGQELLNDSSVTVGPMYFALAAWLWVAQNSFVFSCLGVLLNFLCYKGNMDCFNYACLRKGSIRKTGSWEIGLLLLFAAVFFVNL